MPSSRDPAALQVAIVAASRATIDDLGSYLSGAGVVVTTAEALGEPDTLAADADAVVVFPDELEAGDVVRGIAALRQARPRLLVVVVTGAPQRYRPALDPDPDSFPPVVLARPAFGWTILDAVRDHAAAAEPP